MDRKNSLDSFQRRAVRHAFEDGVIDLIAGFFTLIVGLATQRRALLGIAAAYLIVMSTAWKFLHDRLTDRRTGYAQLPDDPPRRLLSVILIAGCLTMALVAALTLASGRLWSLDQWPTWTPLPAGIILAAGFVHTALRTGFGRYGLFAAVSIGASLFFWLFPFGPTINPSDRLTLSLFVTAAVLIAAGAATIQRFKRRHPLLPEEGSGGL